MEKFVTETRTPGGTPIVRIAEPGGQEGTKFIEASRDEAKEIMFQLAEHFGTGIIEVVREILIRGA